MMPAWWTRAGAALMGFALGVATYMAFATPRCWVLEIGSRTFVACSIDQARDGTPSTDTTGDL